MEVETCPYSARSCGCGRQQVSHLPFSPSSRSLKSAVLWGHGSQCSSTDMSAFPRRPPGRVPGCLRAVLQLRPEGSLGPRRPRCAALRGGGSPLQPGPPPDRRSSDPFRIRPHTAALYLPHLNSTRGKGAPCWREVPLHSERCPELPEGQPASPLGFCRILPGHLP